MKTFAATAVLAACAAADSSNHWAVIMAGSNTYSNYRHQADSHHAVKIMLANGIPREQIIHLAYDDVAESRSNPFKGQLFNKPDPTGPGVNVYDQSEIDYSGDEVNKENFFKVLLGDTTASGPVLSSDADSKVFVYFVDHGGAGVICTPQRSKNWIYADELNDTLKQMGEKGMYGEMVFYLEACESGSMFPNLTDSQKIYALTASNATQSSYAAYCGSEAKVNNKKIGSCLGDLFSINWMEDTEANDPSVETLNEQYQTVLTKTTASPVLKFGEFDFMSEPIGDFEGTNENVKPTTWRERIHRRTHKINHKAKHFINKVTGADEVPNSSSLVSSRDHDLSYWTEQVAETGSDEAYAGMEQEIKHRKFVDELFGAAHFGEMANAPENPQDFECLRFMVGGVEAMCGDWSAYSLQYVRKLANACDTMSEDAIGDLYVKMGTYCEAF